MIHAVWLLEADLSMSLVRVLIVCKYLARKITRSVKSPHSQGRKSSMSCTQSFPALRALGA